MPIIAYIDRRFYRITGPLAARIREAVLPASQTSEQVQPIAAPSVELLASEAENPVTRQTATLAAPGARG